MMNEDELLYIEDEIDFYEQQAEEMQRHKALG